MKAQPWAVALGCFVAGSLAAAGIASATSAPTKIPDSTTGVITACMVKKTGAVRFINAQAGKTCTKKEKKITFNQTGPQGPEGPAGIQGERGPSNGYVAQRTTAKSLSELVVVGGNDITKLTLPAGKYVLSANTSVKATSAQTNSVTCRLTAPAGTLITTPSVASLADTETRPFALAATYSNDAEGSVTLVCWPYDGVIVGFNGAGEANGGTLTATRVAELTGP